MVFDTLMQFKKMLKNMDAMLVKSAGYADHKKFDVAILAQTRLAPDMYPLTKQIQATCDAAKFCAAYMSTQKPPVHEDTETTWNELRERVQKVITYLETFTPEHFTNAPTVKVAPNWAKGKWLPAMEYVEEVAVPNFYFHLNMAYAILRQSGVDIGKMDFMGNINLRD